MTERFSIWRAILVGAVLCSVVPVMAHLSVDLVEASYMAIDHVPVAGVFLFFSLVLLTGLFRGIVRVWQWALRDRGDFSPLKTALKILPALVLSGAFLGAVVLFNARALDAVFGHMKFDANGVTSALAIAVVSLILLGGLFLCRKAGKSEMIIIYTMLIVCCSITTMGLGSQILPIMAAPYQFATTENRWAETLQPYVPTIAGHHWLTPDKEAARGFFEGLDKGESIPWGAWVGPLGFWLIFLIPAYFVMIAVMVILRKQWVEREHLIFPLTVLPVEMSRPPEEGRIFGPFFRNRGMWIGFFAVVFLTSINALHSYWDSFPTIKLFQRYAIFRSTTWLHIRLSFPVIGFTFLINKDLAFSLWFFNLVFLCLTGIFNMAGVRLDENVGIYGCAGQPIYAYLCMGGMMAFATGGLYNARDHLRGVFARAISRDGGTDDSDEIMSYKAAVWGTVASLAVMWVWLSLAGLNPFIVPLFLFFVYILFLGLTRVVSEGGLATLVAAMIAPTALMGVLGVNIIGASGLIVLGLMYVWCADIRTFPMAAGAQGLKMIEECPKSGRRSIVWAIALALVISFVVSMAVSLKFGYTHGGIALNQWFFVGGPKAPFKLMHDKMALLQPGVSGGGPSIPGYLLMGLGTAITAALMALRASFSWFSLHPIGFAVGPVWLMDQLWFSIFLAWLIKSLILRYGGPSIYKKVVPLFLGMVLGQYTAAAFWFVVDLCTGKTGNRVFWI